MIRLLWLVTVGAPLSLALNLLGVLFCLTILGIPRSVRTVSVIAGSARPASSDGRTGEARTS